MEIMLAGLLPILFLVLGIVIVAVSQVSSFFTFSRYSARQRVDNSVIAGFIRGMQAAQAQLAGRSRELALLSRNLAASNQDLDRLNTLKTKFLSMAVHDMRTPLGTIRGYAGMLAKRTGDKREAKIVNGIVVASEQANRLMSDLTDLAVIEAGKLRMENALFDVSGLVADLMATFLPQAEKKAVVLTAEAAPGLRITGDRFRLGQALSNFLGNAIKFTPPGGRVELRAAAQADGAFFSVSDTGPGIDPGERGKIFDKFYQSKLLDPQVGRKGWGLGLSIAQEIVRAHGGDIGVESAGLGRGSRFWFYVPAEPGGREPSASARTGRFSRVPSRPAALGCYLLLLLAGASRPALSRAQTGLPLEDKARYEKFLEEKVETVLLKILGPNRAKVSVDATLDFTRTERFQVTGGAKKSRESEITSGYAWQSVTAQTGVSRELLPGIPMAAGEGLPEFYERQYGYPASFVKKLIVTLVLDKSVSPGQSDALQSIVSDLLEIDPNRGDILSVIHASFAPAWKTLWYSQDSFGMILKYGILSAMVLITLIVLAVCFVRLTSSMDSMARAQAQQYTLDLGAHGEAVGAAGVLPPPEPPPEIEKKTEPEEPGEILIRVRPDQVPTLAEMLKGEDPDNIALVVAHLEPERQQAFMNGLPRELEADVLDRMSNLRFVEPEILEKVKEEIERRLQSAVGGLPRVYDILRHASPERRRDLLNEMESRHPDMAARIRSSIRLTAAPAGPAPASPGPRGESKEKT